MQALYPKLMPYPRRVIPEAGFLNRAQLREAIWPEETVCSFRYLFSLANIKIKQREIPLPSILAQTGETYYALTLGSMPPAIPVPQYEGEEAYALSIAPEGISLCAKTMEGISFGVKTVVKLLRNDEDIPCALIQDAPEIGFRALHLCVFDPDDGTEKECTSPRALRKRLLTAALAGYNYAFLEFWGTFPFERHPYAVWPDTPYTKDIIEALVHFARCDLHIIPCPAQNMTGHAGWSRIASRRHVVLDQRPDLAERYIPGGWCFATENPATKAFLRDVMDELICAFHHPPYFHIGSDKTFGFGSTEQDRTKSADILFAHHISSLNTYLNEQGVRTVMWADMLYSSMDAMYFKCSPRTLECLPRNILMNLWTHNDIGTGWSDVPYFEGRGFSTVYSPFLDIKGVKSMIAQCKRSKSFGIVQTTWHKPETCQPVFAVSGALQWHEIEYSKLTLQHFIQDITSIEREEEHA